MKSSGYRNAAVIAGFLGLLGLLVGCFDMSVSFETTNPDISSSLSTDVTPENQDLASPVASTDSNSTVISNPVTTHSNKSEQNTKKTISILASRQSLSSNTKYLGNLRMSNQTDQPVRLALLARPSVTKGAVKEKTDIPAHWDFDPQEGSEKGLILSLPQGNLKIETGDILVAFAQDGSRRYWGPYVVGESSLPTWDSQKQEWVLLLSNTK
ncbi:hypothetical protein [Nostoc sp. UHCC 0870]|uniref:hypothetical protein n=1 Tax=Nostoc sp. UHCC 0870 TaxID=2914041 RepID=UPI001EDDAAD4|nr:hypothetical protein [Nostoc sp. UHCC 0870]UKO97922.1 hypothetical protein L6494_25785 [Nostoc sp. UHCC 0870]